MAKKLAIDESTTRTDIIALQEQINTLKLYIQDLEENKLSTYATRMYVQTYIEQLLQDMIPIHDSYTEHTLIHGYTPLNIDIVLKHFRNIGGSYTQNDYRNILSSYDSVCKIGNINPYLAVAQMVKETDWCRSWWSQRPRRNPAGIGVTGETSQTEPKDKSAWALDNSGNIWVKGYSFPSWQISAEAHIGHLLAYMYKQKDLLPEYTALVAVDPRAKYIPEITRGTIQILSDLDGKWAVPGVGYGRSIAIIANALRT